MMIHQPPVPADLDERLAGGTKPAGSTGFLGAAGRQRMRILDLAIYMYFLVHGMAWIPACTLTT